MITMEIHDHEKREHMKQRRITRTLERSKRQSSKYPSDYESYLGYKCTAVHNFSTIYHHKLLSTPPPSSSHSISIRNYPTVKSSIATIINIKNYVWNWHFPLVVSTIAAGNSNSKTPLSCHISEFKYSTYSTGSENQRHRKISLKKQNINSTTSHAPLILRYHLEKNRSSTSSADCGVHGETKNNNQSSQHPKDCHMTTPPFMSTKIRKQSR